MKVHGQEWRRRAVCLLETPDAPEVWTPERQPARKVLVHLEQMCRSCPVQSQCAADAVLSGAESGMYAGVWVPQRKPKKSWFAAMHKLQLRAGGLLDEPAALEASA
jgi:WhiB family transcriptional regulator, redox-sensing transcriptional regulator